MNGPAPERGSDHQLAELNIGRLRGPLGSPEVAGFEALLDSVNAIADASPGFVWRLQDEDGNATSVRAFDDELMIVNLSVWESIEALRAFVYTVRDHKRPLREREQWFEPMADPHLVLWWIEAGAIPSVEEAKARLLALREDGPTPHAFTFRESFPAPGGGRREPRTADGAAR